MDNGGANAGVRSAEETDARAPRSAPEGEEAALRHVKPAVRRLEAYTLKHFQPRIKLNQNESPYDVPAELKRDILARAADRPWNRYPPFVAESFMAAVSEATGWPTSGILVANGSNELIQSLLAVVVEPGVSVVVPEPTFTLYRLMTEVHGGTVVSVPLDGELRFDVEAIIEAARGSDASVIVLCTPNNPTGGALTQREIEHIHDATGSLVLLDQAYVEFGGYDALPLLRDRPRLVILRTYSKAMALAGLRAGYLLAHPEVATQVDKAKLPYNVNFFTEIAAAEVMRRRDLLRPYVDEARMERERVHEGLRQLGGVRVFPSQANFLLFRVDSPRVDHRAVFERLLRGYGILVRDVSRYPMLEGCLRVNAGTPAENDEFLAAMRQILTEAEP